MAATQIQLQRVTNRSLQDKVLCGSRVPTVTNWPWQIQTCAEWSWNPGSKHCSPGRMFRHISKHCDTTAIASWGPRFVSSRGDLLQRYRTFCSFLQRENMFSGIWTKFNPKVFSHFPVWNHLFRSTKIFPWLTFNFRLRTGHKSERCYLGGKRTVEHMWQRSSVAMEQSGKGAQWEWSTCGKGCPLLKQCNVLGVKRAAISLQCSTQCWPLE